MSLGDATISGLRKEIAKAREEAKEQLAGGLGIEDFSRYRYSVGFIEALNQIDRAIDQIQDDLMKG